MIYRGVFAISFLLVCALPASADNACVKHEPKVVPCGTGRSEMDKLKAAVNFNRVKGCKEGLQNCICGLVGTGGCDTLSQAEKVALFNNGTDPRHLLNTSDDQIDVIAAHHNARDKATWGKVETFELPYNAVLTRRTAALGLASVLNDKSADFGTVADAVNMCEAIRGDDGPSAPPPPPPATQLPIRPSFMTDFDMDETKLTPEERVAYTAYREQYKRHYDEEGQWMNAMDKWTADDLASKAPVTSSRLTCIFRMADARHFKGSVLLENWPSDCRCGTDSKGIKLDGVCLYGYTAQGFADLPIDKRVPEAMKKFINAFRAKLPPGFTISEVGINGCTNLRFVNEKQTMKSAVDEKGNNPSIGLKHISDHARGVACDVGYIEVKGPGGIQRMQMNPPKPPYTAENPPSPFGPYSFPAALDAFYKGVVPSPIGRSQSSIEYPKLEKLVRDVQAGRIPIPNHLSAAEWEQLRLGVLTRAAFIEAGFGEVVDPLSNPDHHNHFHAGIW